MRQITEWERLRELESRVKEFLAHAECVGFLDDEAQAEPWMDNWRAYLRLETGGITLTAKCENPVHSQPEFLPCPECGAGYGQTNRFLDSMIKELGKAELEHKRYNSHHEAYAVIAEELDEFWDIVRMKAAARVPAETRKELVQIAVTCWRTVRDLRLGGT